MSEPKIRRVNDPFQPKQPVCVVNQSTKARTLFPDGIRYGYKPVYGNYLDV